LIILLFTGFETNCQLIKFLSIAALEIFHFLSKPISDYQKNKFGKELQDSRTLPVTFAETSKKKLSRDDAEASF
jgi:hypothetical protein